MNTHNPATSATAPFDPTTIKRPDPQLLTYYLAVSALTGPFAPLTFLPLYLKYRTLEYRFDDSGIAMSWGILFRRETYLTYQRIQDIHLTRNIIQRWMGLASVSLQTAAGSATPEMTIEGVLAAEPLRDFLYGRMRGAKGVAADTASGTHPNVASGSANRSDELLHLLQDIRDDLRTLAASRGAP